MLSPSRHAVVEFDHHSASYAADNGKHLANLHERGPVVWSPCYDGFWVVSGYAELAAVERDNAGFSSDHDMTGDGNNYQGIVIPEQPFRTVPIEVDPPEFHAYRALLNPYFSPAASREWQPYADQLVDHCLDRITEDGCGDLVEDLANPVPAILTCALLGLPVADWRTYAEPAHQLVYATPGSMTHADAIEKLLVMIEAMRRVIAERRENPRSDLISHLVCATVDGEPLSEQRVVEIVFLVVFGGVDTATGLTANALNWLSTHPAERELLRDDPAAWQHATEEFLRYFSPVQGMARTATHDTELGGCPVRAGDRVHINFAGANRDPSLFSDPDEIKLDRFPNRHVAFGLGIHRCLGSNLARVLFRSMVGGLLRRIPDYAVQAAYARRYTTIGTVNGWETLPVTFTPTPSTHTPLPQQTQVPVANSRTPREEED